MLQKILPFFYYLTFSFRSQIVSDPDISTRVIIPILLHRSFVSFGKQGIKILGMFGVFQYKFFIIVSENIPYANSVKKFIRVSHLFHPAQEDTSPNNQ